MKRNYYSVLLVLITVLYSNCSSENKEEKYTQFKSDNANFSYSGRVHATDSGQQLISAAASIEALVGGDSCVIDVINLNPEVNQYISIAVDSVYLGRFLVNNEPIKIPLHSDSGKNSLLIYKATEAVNGPLLFKGLTTGELFMMPNLEQPYLSLIHI